MLEEEQKIGRQGEWQDVDYGMNDEEEQRKFDEGFSYTNAPEQPKWDYNAPDHKSEVSETGSVRPETESSEEEEQGEIVGNDGHLARFGGMLSDPRYDGR